jgi:hypothetical protein
LYSCYALPLLGLVAQFTRVQLSVIAFAVMTLALANHTGASAPTRDDTL